MENGNNLIPLNRLPESERTKIQEKGREANKRKWKEKLTFRELTSRALQSEITDDELLALAEKFGVTGKVSAKLLMIVGLMRAVIIKGDTGALDRLLELAGESISPPEENAGGVVVLPEVMDDEQES